MPLVSEFYGIRIYMYWDEHSPPHFHAEYNNMHALVSIKDSVVIKGLIPAKQLKLVLAWCTIHEDELLRNWECAQEHEEIQKIDPLKWRIF